VLCFVQKDEPRSSVLRGGLLSPRKVDTHARLRNKRKPPRGMYLNADSLMSFATSPAAQADALLKKFDAELVELKRQVDLSFFCFFCVILFIFRFCVNVVLA